MDTVIQPVRVGGSRPEMQPGNPVASAAQSGVLASSFASDDGQSAGAKQQDTNFASIPDPMRSLLQQAKTGAGTQVR